MCPNTLKGLKVDDKGCFHSANLMINFDTDKAVVKKEYMPKLETFAKFLNESEPVNVVIEGHTDSTASDAHNQKLSEKRANAVMDILIKEYKVDSKRLKAVGYGETKPIASNKTKKGRAENRRIMAVVDKETQVAK
jgi:OOP family OmpA-OmpF porin